VPVVVAATRITLLFWSGNTTLPLASKTAANGEPSEADKLAPPLAMLVVAPPPATVVMTSDPEVAAELGDTPTSADPMATEQTSETIAPQRRCGRRGSTGTLTLCT
jgi:hypothetical protein